MSVNCHFTFKSLVIVLSKNPGECPNCPHFVVTVPITKRFSRKITTMVLSRLTPVLRGLAPFPKFVAVRSNSTKYGGIPPEPYRTSLGILRVILTVIPGLLIGAAISKHMANFLEENDLFVPSDDDDDDD